MVAVARIGSRYLGEAPPFVRPSGCLGCTLPANEQVRLLLSVTGSVQPNGEDGVLARSRNRQFEWDPGTVARVFCFVKGRGGDLCSTERSTTASRNCSGTRRWWA